jgi:catechol 2,3-dioxygenase-like lactoylglutathione lyase family enzyme
VEDTLAITAIRSVPIYVTDFDRAIEFYVDRLGMIKRTDATKGPIRWVELGVAQTDTVLSLIGPDYPIWSQEKVGVNTGIVFGAASADELDALSAAGVQFESAPERTAWGTQGRFRDPDGNVFLVIAGGE